MALNDVIFVDNLPKLDLHGLDRDCSKLYIKTFIQDNIVMKNEVVTIVHGIGSGALKQATHEYLKTDKNVVEFKTFYYNAGCTIVRIKF